ncbi:MAG: 4Fe-4S binding protein [Bacteroidales bacterium]
MRELVILSGKGGTGKTSITAAFSSLAQNAVFCDSDVDAANLHLVFDPTVIETHIFEGGYLPQINKALCNQCGICTDYCRFGAIKTTPLGELFVDPLKCEGCRLCERVCPPHAITSQRSNNSRWYLSSSRFGPLVHAEMGPGEDNSGKLVTKLRNKAAAVSRVTKAAWIINDGPPGIGCSAIASLTGADAVVVVTEPSAPGLHDLGRVLELIDGFRIPTYAIINKHDLHPSSTQRISAFLESKNIPLIALVPFSENFTSAMVNGQSIIEYAPESEIAGILTRAWEKL